MNFRKFYLIRGESGAQRPLNGENAVWLTDPAGLGTAAEPVIANLGGGFHCITDDRKKPQQQFTFTLNFTGADPYGDYKALIDWIAATSVLQLGYKPADKLYTRRIVIKAITKTELTKTRWLACTVSAVALEPWTRSTSLSFANSSSGTNFSWSAPITPAGQLPMHYELTFKAAAARKINGVYLSGMVDGESKIYGAVYFSTPVQLAARQSLVVSTIPTNFRVDGVTAIGTIVSQLSEVDIIYDPTEGLPVTVTSAKLNVSVDAYTSADTVTGKVYEYYEGV